MTLRALLFDVDGTLADTERDGHRPAFNQAFADAGLDWPWGVALYGKLLAVTGGKERMKYYIDPFRPDYSKPDNRDELGDRVVHGSSAVDVVGWRPGEEVRVHAARAVIAAGAYGSPASLRRSG